MSADEYTLQPDEFPSPERMERVAKSCPEFVYCAERPFSFCLKRCVKMGRQLYYRKVTYKHCWECTTGTGNDEG